MAINPYSDETAILDAIKTKFTGYRVVEEILDGTQIQYTDGVMVPYIAVSFGSPIASATGRSIAAEEKQPTDQRIIISGVAGSVDTARQIAGRIARDLTGLDANANVGPLRLIGGGSYIVPVPNGPTQYVRDTYFLYLGNMMDV